MSADFPDDCPCCAPFVYQWSGAGGPKLIGTGDSAIPGDGDWVKFSSNGVRHYGILADGSLWGWGQGPIGDGTLNSYERPKRIDKGPWIDVSAGAVASIAIRQNGTMWSWGSNSLGQLGNGKAYPDFTAGVDAAIGILATVQCPVAYTVPAKGSFSWNSSFPPVDPPEVSAQRVWSISGVSMTSQGSGYLSPPTISVLPESTGFSAQPVMSYRLSSIAMTAGGSGYTSAVAVVSPGGRVFNVQLNNGAVSAVEVPSAALLVQYASPPTVEIVGNGSGAAAECSVRGSVQSVTITSPGAFSAFPQSISFAGGNPTSPAAGLPQRRYSVSSVSMAGLYGGDSEQLTLPNNLGIGVLGESITPLRLLGTGQYVVPFYFTRLAVEDSSLAPDYWEERGGIRPFSVVYSAGDSRLPSEAYIVLADGGLHPLVVEALQPPLFRVTLSERIETQHGGVIKVIFPEDNGTPGPTPESPQPHWSRHGEFGFIGPFPGGGEIANKNVSVSLTLPRCRSDSGRWRLLRANSLVPFAPSGNWDIVDQIGGYFVIAQNNATETEFTGTGTDNEFPRVFTYEYGDASGRGFPPPPPRLTTGFGQQGGVVFPNRGLFWEDDVPPAAERELSKYRTFPEYLAATGGGPRREILYSLPDNAYIGAVLSPPDVEVFVGPAVCRRPAVITGTLSPQPGTQNGILTLTVSDPGEGYRHAPFVTATTLRLSPQQIAGAWQHVEINDQLSQVIAVDSAGEFWHWGGSHIWAPARLGWNVEFAPAVGYISKEVFEQDLSAFAEPETLGYWPEVRGAISAASDSPPRIIIEDESSDYLGDPLPLYEVNNLTSADNATFTGFVLALQRWLPCSRLGAETDGPIPWTDVDGAFPETLAAWQPRAGFDDIGIVIDGAQDKRFSQWVPFGRSVCANPRHPSNKSGNVVTISGVRNYVHIYNGYKSTFGGYIASPPYSRDIVGISQNNYKVLWDGLTRVTAPSLSWGTATVIKPQGAIVRLWRDGGNIFGVTSNDEIWRLSAVSVGYFANTAGSQTFRQPSFLAYPEASSRAFKKLEAQYTTGDESAAAEWVDSEQDVICRADANTIDARFRLVVTNPGAGYTGSSVRVRLFGGDVVRFQEEINIEHELNVSTRIMPNRAPERVAEVVVSATHRINESTENVDFDQTFAAVPVTVVSGCILSINQFFSFNQILSAIPQNTAAYFTTLPSVEILPDVGQSGSGATARIALAEYDRPGLGNRQMHSRISDAFSALGVSVPALANRSSQLLVDSSGLIRAVSYFSVPLPPKYQHGYSAVVGLYAFTTSGALYFFPTATSRPIAINNVEVRVEDMGSNYPLLPVMQPSSQSSTETATAVAEFAGSVVSVCVRDGGSGYTSPPDVIFDPPGALAVAAIEGGVSLVSVTSGGAGYVYPPRVVFSGNGVHATATAVLDSSGAVSSVLVTDGGRYRSPPAVTFVPTNSVTAISITNGGLYARPPSVVIVHEEGAEGAAATATINGAVVEVEIVQGGSGYSPEDPPLVTFSDGNATAIAIVSEEGVISSIQVTSGGSGYQSPPRVVISGGRGAVARARILGPVQAITVTSVGGGFRSAPAVLFQGGGGTADAAAEATIGQLGGGAVAAAQINGSLLYVRVTLGGEYDYPPRVSFSGTGTGAAAASRVVGTVSGISVTNPGTGYGSDKESTCFVSDGIREVTLQATVGENGQVLSIPAPAGEFLQKPKVYFSDSFTVQPEAVRNVRKYGRALRSQPRVSRNAASHAFPANIQGASPRPDLASVVSSLLGPWAFRNVRALISDVLSSGEASVSLSAGVVTGIAFDANGRSGETRLLISEADLFIERCEGECIVDDETGSVVAVNVTSQGSGYLSPVVIVHGGGGEGCVALAFPATNGQPSSVAAVVVTAGGSGYSSENPPRLYVYEGSRGFLASPLGESIKRAMELLTTIEYATAVTEYARPLESVEFAATLVISAGGQVGGSGTSASGNYFSTFALTSGNVDTFISIEGIESVQCGLKTPNKHYYAFTQAPAIICSTGADRQPAFSTSLALWNPDVFSTATLNPGTFNESRIATAGRLP